MADKTKTIKNASDKDIDELIVRLRKENELQDLVASLKRKSTPLEPFTNPISYDRPEVSTDVPIESLYHNEKVEDSLAHFGILGMKWGVRRKPGSNGRVQKGLAEDYTESRKMKSKGYKNMSDAELRKVTQRMQLEKQMRDLSLSEKTKGMEVVKAVTAAGTTLAALYGLSKTPAGQAVVGGIKEAIKSESLRIAYKKAMGG